MTNKQAFTVMEGEIRRDIFVPKYYDPSLLVMADELELSHELVPVSALIASGELEMRQGNYIGKMHYGTGTVPYIRTSDIANWELRGSPKHGVSDAVAQVYRQKQDLLAGDLLLVHEGTYLIGTACLITEFDTEALYQHHLARLRVARSDRLDGPLLMCAILSDFVQRQIRSKQFTADVIDSIVGRFLEVLIPIPRSRPRRDEFSAKATNLFERRARARIRLAMLRRLLEEVLKSQDWDAFQRAIEDAPSVVGSHGVVSFLGSSYGSENFVVTDGSLIGDILIPKYYDPEVRSTLQSMDSGTRQTTIGELSSSGVIELITGDEVGKLAYGTGSVPFVRTSDLGNWELKHDPKQLVSELVYEQFKAKQPIAAEDILLVRDGTYLVGSSAMVMPDDLPMLISGGIYRIRVLKPDVLDPYLLLALLNTEVAGRQMRNKRFTRDVIDTLGRRLEEVVLPVPMSAAGREVIASTMRALVQERAALRTEIAGLGRDLVDAR